MRRQNLLAVAKELRQVAVAVSVVGTRRGRMLQLVAKIRPIRDEVTWLRPETRKLRSTLVRAVHNMERAPTHAGQVKNLKAAAGAIEGLAKLIGASQIPKVVQVGGVNITNAWGYSARELMPVVRRLQKAVTKLESVGFKGITGIEVVANPEESPNSYASYSSLGDVIYLNPGKSGKADGDLMRAFGDRLWSRAFEGKDKATWGSGTSGWSKFASAWVSALDGRWSDPDTIARLAVTAGRLASAGQWAKTVL